MNNRDNQSPSVQLILHAVTHEHPCKQWFCDSKYKTKLGMHMRMQGWYHKFIEDHKEFGYRQLKH